MPGRIKGIVWASAPLTMSAGKSQTSVHTLGKVPHTVLVSFVGGALPSAADSLAVSASTNTTITVTGTASAKYRILAIV